MTRETAINLLDNLIGMVEDNQQGDYDEAFKLAIRSLKSWDEDVAPVVHGKWIIRRNSQISHERLITNYECSICHTWSRYHSNYCPDCGAKMDLKEVKE